jgi:hypothetical protein
MVRQLESLVALSFVLLSTAFTRVPLHNLGVGGRSSGYRNAIESVRTRRMGLSMHMGHSHSHHHHGHGHDHSHDHDHHDEEEDDEIRREKMMQGPELSFSLFGQILRPKNTLLRRPLGKIVLAALIVAAPALIRKKFTRFDAGAFAVLSTALTAFDSIRFALKKWISRVKLFQEGLVKHSTPITRQYFFKNENAADRITLLGVYINVILSVVKFVGGLGELSRHYRCTKRSTR